MSQLVTVIIPAFNYGRFLGKAIDSVLAQTYEPIELIVVDSGSTDNTPEILALYQGQLKVITRENRGPSVARNIGILAAKGEYIAFLDADDWWEPDKITIQMLCLKEHPEMGAVGCGERRVKNGQVIETITPKPFTKSVEENIRAVAIRRLWVAGTTSGVLIRRHVFDTIGMFDESLFGAEDWDMWLRLVSTYFVYNLPNTLLNRRIHNQGFARDASMLEDRAWQVYEKSIKRWPEVFDWKLRQQVKGLILADAGDEYFCSKNLSMAVLRYGMSLLEWPFMVSRWKSMVSLCIKLMTKCLH